MSCSPARADFAVGEKRGVILTYRYGSDNAAANSITPPAVGDSTGAAAAIAGIITAIQRAGITA